MGWIGSSSFCFINNIQVNFGLISIMLLSGFNFKSNLKILQSKNQLFPQPTFWIEAPQRQRSRIRPLWKLSEYRKRCLCQVPRIHPRRCFRGKSPKLDYYYMRSLIFRGAENIIKPLSLALLKRRGEASGAEGWLPCSMK